MNIFAIYTCPIKSAQHLVDDHVKGGKMAMEACQMLANCFPLEVLARLDCPKTQKLTTRKHSYFNHPCSIWVRKSRANMQWMIDHARALFTERLERFPDRSEHFSKKFLDWCLNNINLSNVVNGPLTPFAMAMPDEIQNISDPIHSYRQYYKLHKQHLHQWTRNRPDWI